jgi:hypothetical protein
MPFTVLMSDVDGPERLILKADAIHRWRGRKRGRTLLKTYVGRLLLTDRRLVHLSSGGSGVAEGVAMTLFGAAPGAVGRAASIADAATNGVDWVVGKVRDRKAGDAVRISAEALAVDGSLDLPLESIEDVGLTVKLLSTHLWVVARTSAGETREYTFADRITMPNGRLWEPAIRAARAELMAGDRDVR